MYSRDQRTPDKASRSVDWLRTLRNQDGLVLSPQVLNEAFSVSGLKFRDVASSEVAEWIRHLQPYCTAPLDSRTVGLALDLHQEHRLAWWDCPIVASAIMAGCVYLLSEDMQHQQLIRTVRVINPFRVAPSDILNSN
ncbi:PIN domain-containing protein [Kaistia dalseonensis]|uniref:PIN domain-containing protein n=1 Tax=Kaistia dalseonensis TaxID=410840 RepID=UPI002257C766|nr:PIN domain-containing protein [Kaistia dalseonensis]MCX5495194.1 PIN domain-containing protein [Kaistia dalseonensis]